MDILIRAMSRDIDVLHFVSVLKYEETPSSILCCVYACYYGVVYYIERWTGWLSRYSN